MIRLRMSITVLKARRCVTEVCNEPKGHTLTVQLRNKAEVVDRRDGAHRVPHARSL